MRLKTWEPLLKTGLFNFIMQFQSVKAKFVQILEEKKKNSSKDPKVQKDNKLGREICLIADK